MADIETVETQTRWFCHSCNSEIVPDLTEFQCSNCGGGFIEAIESETETEADTTGLSFQDAEVQPVNHHHHHHHRHNHPPTHTHHNENRPPFTDSPFSFNFSLPFGGSRNVANFVPPPPPFDGFHGFVEQLLFGLMGSANNQQQQQQQFPPATFSIQFGPNLFNGNTGDYVFSAEGLDNIVTMLMNQLEGTGPPPASREQVDALPVISITQAHVDDNLQCHVCMENFQLDEKVKELPCRHVYHGDCIVPWLELHGTCPVCRKRIESTNPNTERFNSVDART